MLNDVIEVVGPAGFFFLGKVSIDRAKNLPSLLGPWTIENDVIHWRFCRCSQPLFFSKWNL